MGWVGNDTEYGFWTSTVWERLDAMRAYRNSGVHMKSMPKLLRWCDEASFAHWEQVEPSAPSVDLAYQQLSQLGKLSKVNAPSPRHQAGQKVGQAAPRTTQHLKKPV
jgi:hypothetical protein